MQLELSALMSQLGQAVQAAQDHLERQGVERYCSYFAPAARTGAEEGEVVGPPPLRPVSYCFAIPDGAGGTNQVEVPEAALVQHSTMALDTVQVRLNVLPSLREGDGAVLVEVGPSGEGVDGTYSQLELTFRSGPSSEGIARVNQKTIQTL